MTTFWSPGGGEGARQADAHTLPQLEEAGGGAEDRWTGVQPGGGALEDGGQDEESGGGRGDGEAAQGEGSNVDGVGGEAGHRPEGGGVGGRVAH